MKTTKTHFNIFKKEFLRWQKKLGLLDWQVYFDHAETPGHFGKMTTLLIQRTATVTFTSDWHEGCYPLTEKHIQETAKHETIHLLTADLFIIATARFVTKDEIECAEEALVIRLEKLL